MHDGVPGQVGAEHGAEPPGARAAIAGRERSRPRLGRVGVGHDPELVGEPAPGGRDRPQAVGAADRARVLAPERRAQRALRRERGGLVCDHGRRRRSNGTSWEWEWSSDAPAAGPSLIAASTSGRARRAVAPARRSSQARSAVAATHLGRQLGEGGDVRRAVDHAPPGPGWPGTCSGTTRTVQPGVSGGAVRRGPAPAPRAASSPRGPRRTGRSAASAIRVVRPSAPGPAGSGPARRRPGRL